MGDDIGIEPTKRRSSLAPIHVASYDESPSSPKVDSAASSIEKSKSVRSDLIPAMHAPILSVPAGQDYVVFSVKSTSNAERTSGQVVDSFIFAEDKIKERVLKGWLNNLREIEEQVRQLLNSPLYRLLLEISTKGDPALQSVGSIQGTGAANQDLQNYASNEFFSTLSRLQAMEKIPRAAEIVDASSSKDSTQVLVLPLAGALLAGGVVTGIAAGGAAAQPIGSVVQLIENLQPLLPSVALQDVVPLINLMLMGPLYFNSWNEATLHFKSHKERTHVPVIQKFAKDVISIVTDPRFINTTIIQQIKGSKQLSQDDERRLGSVLKLILLGVALSLMYSAEVGKVQDGKFAGMEPEELKSLLQGDWTDLSDPKKDKSEHEQITGSLIKRVWEQLHTLSSVDRAKAIAILFDYIAERRDLSSMLEPARVFQEVIQSQSFDPQARNGENI